MKLSLHRTNGTPDWELVPPAERTALQRIAAATGGVATLANALSVLGFVLVVLGLAAIMRHDLLAGVIYIAAGRTCDLLDGLVADRTATKSPVGEVADAGFDKLGAVAALIVMWAEHIVPWWAVTLIGIQNVTNIIIGTIGWYRKREMHPVRAGKVSTALEWLAFLCFILAAGSTAAWAWPAYGLLATALLLGAYATVSYGRELGNAAASAMSASNARRT